jgi:hypothetical protein
VARATRTGLIVLVLVGALRADDVTEDAAALRARGVEALPAVLGRVESEDADERLRARRLARAIVLDYLEAKAPKGMKLVPGRLHIAASGVRMEGGFYLGRTEVTLRAFRAWAKEAGLDTKRWAEGDAALPVGGVTLEEARAFAKAKGARIPTREELEFAATAGARYRYPWGDHLDPGRVNSRDSAAGKAEPAGSRKAGVSAHGIADLVGNVAEWTETPTRPGSHKFLVVGGSYKTWARARFVTYKLHERHRLPDVGFRLAHSLPALPASKGS